MKDWDAHVWRTDTEEREYIGFFLDDAQAQAWVKTQTTGTFEVTDKGPRSSA